MLGNLFCFLSCQQLLYQFSGLAVIMSVYLFKNKAKNLKPPSTNNSSPLLVIFPNILGNKVFFFSSAKVYHWNSPLGHLSFYFFKMVSVLVCVCVWMVCIYVCMCVVEVLAHVKARNWHQDIFLNHSSTLLFKNVSQWTQNSLFCLCWLASEPWGLPVFIHLPFPHQPVVLALPMCASVPGFKWLLASLRSSCLCSRHFVHSIISLIHTFIFVSQVPNTILGM